jgi:hypothetical protein
MSADYALIKRCSYADEATCNNGCKWRAGLDVAKNDQVDFGMPLLENNFCHPPTTEKWSEQLPGCIFEM